MTGKAENGRGKRFCEGPGLALLLLASLPALAQPPAEVLRQHMQHIVNTADEWRTANPAYTDGSDIPAEFGLRFVLADDGSHATGELRGLYSNGKSALYWTLMTFYNPATEKIIVQQVGWDGTLIRGETEPQTGSTQTIDAIEYGSNGTMKIVRHVQTYDHDQHTSSVYERNANGQWHQVSEWLWRRHPLDQPVPLPASKPPAQPTPLHKVAGHLVAGSGQWRVRNPDDDPSAPTHFGMNYRWGPYGQYLVGEIISIYRDGRIEKDWSKYLTYNPVTGIAYLEQTNDSATYFRGELTPLGDNAAWHTGIVYKPDGTAISVRDKVLATDPNSFVSVVFERDQAGQWQADRQWHWELQP